MTIQIVFDFLGGAGSPSLNDINFGDVEFHLPIGLSLCEAVQVISQDLEINGEFYIPIQNKIISKETNSIFASQGYLSPLRSLRSSSQAIGTKSTLFLTQEGTK